MNTCHYKEEEDGIWITECGHSIGPSLWDGFGSHFVWCPFCGCEVDKAIYLSAEDVEAEKADLWLQERKDMDLI